MAATPTQTGKIRVIGHITVYGTIAFTGNYAAGGDAIVLPKPGTTKAPVDVRIEGVSGFRYSYDHVNAKVKVFGYTPTSATAGVIPQEEIAAAAYPAGVTGDVVRYIASYPTRG